MSLKVRATGVNSMAKDLETIRQKVEALKAIYDVRIIVNPKDAEKLRATIGVHKGSFDLCRSMIVSDEMVVEGQAFELHRDKMLSQMQMSRHMLAWHECDCPFDHMTEHEKWFEWKWRVYANKEHSGQVTGDMANWDEVTIEKCKKQVRFYSKPFSVPFSSTVSGLTST